MFPCRWYPCAFVLVTSEWFNPYLDTDRSTRALTLLWPVSFQVLVRHDVPSSVFIVFDMDNRIFGLPRELVVTVAGKVRYSFLDFGPEHVLEVRPSSPPRNTLLPSS